MGRSSRTTLPLDHFLEYAECKSPVWFEGTHNLISLCQSKKDTIDPKPRNLLFETFKCEDAKRTVWGNIVVVKSDRNGKVVDVKERDIFFIERIVYRCVQNTPVFAKHSQRPLGSYFEDDHADEQYPVVRNPLFAARPDWGWGARRDSTGGWA